MTSQGTLPLQFLATASELLFLLDAKLCMQRDSTDLLALERKLVLEGALCRVLAQIELSDLFVERNPLSLEELRDLFKVMADEPVTFVGDGYEKLLVVACMLLKAQLSGLCGMDVSSLLDRKLTSLQNLFDNPLAKEHLRRRQEAASVFYADFSCAELNRVRSTMLNTLRGISVPIKDLTKEALQLESGRIACFKNGPKDRDVGIFRTFSADGVRSQELKFALAEAGDEREKDGDDFEDNL